jgi:hypothetical protein
MRTFKPTGAASVLLTSLFWLAQGASAQPAGGGDMPRQPPPEALAACKSLASGAACSFTSPRGPETGTCWAPQGKPLACKPAHGPQGPNGGGQPPQKP